MEDETLPSPEAVLAIHEEIEDEYDLTYTGASVAAPKLELREIISEAGRYDDLYMRAGCLLRKLVTAHLFEDGNKRTAWSTTELYLEFNDTQPAERGESVERILTRIRRYDVAEIADWLETGNLDRSRLDP